MDKAVIVLLMSMRLCDGGTAHVNLKSVQASALQLTEHAQSFLGQSRRVGAPEKISVKIWEILEVDPTFKVKCLGVEDVTIDGIKLIKAKEEADQQQKPFTLVVNAAGHKAVDAAKHGGADYAIESQGDAVKTLLKDVQGLIKANHNELQSEFVMMGWSSRDGEHVGKQFEVWCYPEGNGDASHCPRMTNVKKEIEGDVRVCPLPSVVELHAKGDHVYKGTAMVDMSEGLDFSGVEEITAYMFENEPTSLIQAESKGEDTEVQFFESVKEQFQKQCFGTQEKGKNYENIKFMPPDRFVVTCVEGVTCPAEPAERLRTPVLPIVVEVFDIDICKPVETGEDKRPDCGNKLGTDIFDLAFIAPDEVHEYEKAFSNLEQEAEGQENGQISQKHFESTGQQVEATLIFEGVANAMKKRSANLKAMGQFEFDALVYTRKDKSGHVFQIWCKPPRCPARDFLTITGS